MRIKLFIFSLMTIIPCYCVAQVKYTEKGQAYPPATQHFGKEAFAPNNHTVIRWLGNAGFFINSRGTCIMVDPLLIGFDMPLLIEPPILPEKVPALDAVLITHSDNDHFSIPTCEQLAAVCQEYHSTLYVDSLMKLTPAWHTWQNEFGGFDHVFQREDYCGFLIQTADGLVWAPGDSRFLPEFLRLPTPDVIFFDFSDDGWHIGLDNAVKIANAYPDAQLLLSHWGTVDAPDMKPFNADPKDLEGRIVNPERIHVLAPGEAFTLKASKETE